MWNACRNEGLWEYDMDWISDDENLTEDQLRRKNIAELKWFHKDEVEKAREYYSQFLYEEHIIENRQDYFNDPSCILSLVEEFDEGEFCIEEDIREEYDGYVCYYIENSNNRMYELQNMVLNSDYRFEGGYNAVGHIVIDLFKREDGTYRVLARELIGSDIGKGTGLAFYEADEEFAIRIYSSSDVPYDMQPHTMEELIAVLSE